jgi:type I restriction enzyme, R subunit
MTYTERDLETLVEKGLVEKGYRIVSPSLYDRERCLIVSELVQFLKDSQPKSWKRFQEFYGEGSSERLSKLVSDQISTRGVVDTLRDRVKDRGIHLNLAYFQPRSGLNPEHQRLHETNRFSVVRQLKFSKKNEDSIDVVLFLNGIPLVTMELKNELTGQNITHSQEQYRRRDSKEPIFRFKRCMVHFGVDQDRVTMTTRVDGPKTRFLPFNKALENPLNPKGPRTHYLWEDVLRPNSVLDIIENFVHTSEITSKEYDSRTKKVRERTFSVLIFPRYHQWEVIRRLKESLVQDGVGKNYLIQHTTGSGKSYSIGWLSHLLSQLFRSPNDTERIFGTVVVVTDRKVLDDQLGRTIQSLEKTRGTVVRVETSEELRKALELGKTILVTTIQKFPIISKSIESLTSQTFAVIVDEAHASQTGKSRDHLDRSLSVGRELEEEEDEEELDDLDKKILEIMKKRGDKSHVSFFAFTGTPKNRTIEMFGTRGEDGMPRSFHTYSMKQSIGEGFTLDVLRDYTTYKRLFALVKKIEDDPRVPESTSRKNLLRLVDEHPHSIQEKVRIILEHFHRVTRHRIGGKGRGMVVVGSRRMCVLYTLEMRRQLERMGNPYNCLVGFSGTVRVDGLDYSEKSLNPGVMDIPESFKLPQNRILIASNKFQTGFDEPLLHSMYVDKKLRGLNCVQSLSRLNRTTEGKTDTFVLDFVNEIGDVVDSFQLYYTTTELETTTDPNRLYELQREIESYHLYTDEERDEVCRIVLDQTGRPKEAMIPILDGVVGRWRELEDQEGEGFRFKVRAFVRLYGFISRISDFHESEWEKMYLFLFPLDKKLIPVPPPKNGTPLGSLVDLEYFRVEKTYEGGSTLLTEPGVLPVVQVRESRPSEEEEIVLLSRIIEIVNERFGGDFSGEDRVNLQILLEKSLESEELDRVHEGDNTPTNKEKVFKKEVERVLVGMVNDRLDFYKKVKGSPEVESLLLSLLYQEYLSLKGYRYGTQGDRG